MANREVNLTKRVETPHGSRYCRVVLWGHVFEDDYEPRLRRLAKSQCRRNPSCQSTQIRQTSANLPSDFPKGYAAITYAFGPTYHATVLEAIRFFLATKAHHAATVVGGVSSRVSRRLRVQP